MSTSTDCGKFSFKDRILVNNLHPSIRHTKHHGSIYGKIKDKLAYVVSLRGLDHNNHAAHLMFGSPNRHLELEWGMFTGAETEFIIAENELKEFK